MLHKPKEIIPKNHDGSLPRIFPFLWYWMKNVSLNRQSQSFSKRKNRLDFNRKKTSELATGKKHVLSLVLRRQMIPFCSLASTYIAQFLVIFG